MVCRIPSNVCAVEFWVSQYVGSNCVHQYTITMCSTIGICPLSTRLTFILTFPLGVLVIHQLLELVHMPVMKWVEQQPPEMVMLWWGFCLGELYNAVTISSWCLCVPSWFLIMFTVYIIALTTSLLDGLLLYILFLPHSFLKILPSY